MRLRDRPVGRRVAAVTALAALLGIGSIVHEVGPTGMPGFLFFAAVFVPFIVILCVFFRD